MDAAAKVERQERVEVTAVQGLVKKMSVSPCKDASASSSEQSTDTVATTIYKR